MAKMKKRYYQSPRDRRNERQGMEKRLQDRFPEFYAGISERRRQEFEDEKMIHEDRTAMANLPQEVMIKPYPKPAYLDQPDLNDTISGVDEQIKKDSHGRTLKKGPYPEKY